MYFFKRPVLKVVLPLVFALNIFTGTLVEASTPPPVQLQTYGVLPVMVLNLTQSPINYNVSTNAPSAYTSASAPVAIGLHGWSYITSGNATAMFNNPTTPSIAPQGAKNPSLNPALYLPSGATPSYSPSTVNSNGSFMSTFALFPSWSGLVMFPNTYYRGYSLASGSSSMGATPGPNAQLTWWTNTPATAFAQSMKASSFCYINLNLLNSTSGTTSATYQLSINSLGGGNSSWQQPQQNPSTPVDWYGDILQIAGDLYTIVSTDGIAAFLMILGIPDTVAGVYDSYNSNSSTVTTNQPYPATYNGIQVTALAPLLPVNATFAVMEGNNDYLVYNTQASPSTTTLPLEMQNSVFFATWRQPGPPNSSTGGRKATDTLIVAVINAGVLTAQKTQVYLNNENKPQSALNYHPTKEQAEDTLKILGLLTAISKKNPQDAQKIVDLFGFYGQYKKSNNNPGADANIKSTLKEVLEKYQRDFPVIEQYLAKLAQKR